ncbi:MAG TPA: hypothetical protein VIT00_10695 [Terrimicrobiaceae bacterium]
MKFDSRIVPHAGWEMTLMRIAFAAMVWQSVPSFYYQTTLSHPNGLAHFLDLTFLMNPEVLGILRGLLAAAVLFYAAGLFMFLSLGVMTFMLAACGSLENSQGAINHSLQPLALVALAQWGVAGYFAVRDHVARKRPFFPVATGETHRRLVHAAKVALVSCYVTSAFTKLERTDGQWILRAPNLAVAIAKTNTKSYLNILEPADHLAKAVPQVIIEHPNLTRIFFGFGIALELFAFLALMGRWPAIVIGTSLILMHDMIARVMDLHFSIFERLAFIFLVNAPWLAVFAIGSVWNLASRWMRRAAGQDRSERASIS